MPSRFHVFIRLCAKCHTSSRQFVRIDSPHLQHAAIASSCAHRSQLFGFASMTSAGSVDPPASALSHLRLFASPGVGSTHLDVRLLRRLCESIKYFLKAKGEALVRDAAGSPVLMSYSFDGTPLSVKTRMTAEWEKGAKVAITGRATSEYLVQHMYYRTYGSTGRARTCLVIRDPLPLTSGKSAWALWSAGQEFKRTPMQIGHTGISIVHYVFDRAGYSALLRMNKQFHAHLHDSQMSTPLQKLQEWVVSSGCGLHDCHNGLKWGMHTHFNDPSLMKDIYIVIESLRNSHNLIQRHLRAWIADKVQFADEWSGEESSVMGEMWTTLGVEPAVVEVLVADLQLRWQGGSLQVAAKWAASSGLVEKVSFCLLSLWHFRSFSDSRWVSVGCSCRTLATGLLTGLDSLVARIRADPGSSDYHISGYARLQNEARKLVLSIAVASFVSDACLGEMLEDNRVALRLSQIRESATEEMEWVTRVSPAVWSAMGAACGDVGGHDLRHRAIAAAHISLAFIDVKVFRVAAGSPWNLATGDQDSNLASLAAGPEPTEPVAQKVWNFVNMGYNKVQLKLALDLLLDCPWGTASAEQQHASATLMKKFHPEYSEETLMVRSLIHSARNLLPVLSEEDSVLRKTATRVDKILEKKPQHLTGRQVFLGDLIKVAKEWRQSGKRNLPGAYQLNVMSGHGKTYKALPEGVRHRYEAIAGVRRAASALEWQSQLEEASATMLVAHQRKKAKTSERSAPLSLGCSRFSPEDEDELNALFASPDFSLAQAEVLRKIAVVAPPEPSAAVKSVLGSHDVEQRQPATPKPQ